MTGSTERPAVVEAPSDRSGHDDPRRAPEGGEPVTRPGRRRIAELAGSHLPFALALAGGVTLRVIAGLAYRPALFYVDSFRYLNNPELAPDFVSPAGYAAVVQGLLRLGDLGLIPIVHYVLGLAMATALYALARRWGAPGWLATVGVLPLLLDGYQLQSETRIMPETVFQAVLIASFVTLVWRRRPAAWQVALAALLAGVAVPVRLVGLVVIAPLLVAVALSSPTQRSAVARIALAFAVFAAPVALYGAYVHAETGVVGLGRADLTPRMLYARVARYVDCDAAAMPDALRPLCPTPFQQRTMPTDDFAWHERSPLNQFAPLVLPERFREVATFDRIALRSDPAAFARLVVGDFLKNFAWSKETFAYDMPVERWRFRTSLPLGNDVEDIQTAYDIYGGGPSRLDATLAAVLRRWQLGVGHLPGTLLGVALAVGLVGGIAPLARRRWTQAERTRSAAALLFSGAGLALLVLPALYQFSWRYQLPSLALVPSGAVLAVTALGGARPAARFARPGRAGGATGEA